jgi:hypothetical protein
MTANWNTSPNSLHCSGDRTYSQRFGGLYSLTPVSIPGAGHHAHLTLRFVGDLRVDLDPATALALAQQLPDALKRLGVLPDCSAIAATVEGSGL